ncbi:hypothetical protein [Neolewinella litorea]|uniref:SGNH/GDSL hydrolase family protein n=1 Tax=Neolewinella litorea TaxID=2562452 RepID=A0A4S4N701_9BACT|nr:hypothetical protein [Neolewinella litorea]THH34275.1 hypothetical protein E4021_17850 [Neolewinella litorea]
MHIFIINLLKFSFVLLLTILAILSIFRTVLDSHTTYSSLFQDGRSTLILGDSQTETGLNDSLINNSINLSNSGDPVFFNYVKLKKLLDAGFYPEILILGFTPDNLYSEGFYEVPKMKSKLKNYFFMVDYGDLQDIITKNFSGFYQGAIGNIFYSPVRNNFWSDVDISNIGIGGYRILPSDNLGQLEKDISENKVPPLSPPDDISIKYLYRIISLCNRNSIKLIIMHMPIHSSLQEKEMQRKKRYDLFIKRIQGDVTLWDYSDYEFDDKYFYDDNHLNDDGATIFSAIIDKKLQLLAGM